MPVFELKNPFQHFFMLSSIIRDILKTKRTYFDEESWQRSSKASTSKALTTLASEAKILVVKKLSAIEFYY